MKNYSEAFHGNLNNVVKDLLVFVKYAYLVIGTELNSAFNSGKKYWWFYVKKPICAFEYFSYHCLQTPSLKVKRDDQIKKIDIWR